MRTAQTVPGDAVIAVVGRPGIMAGDPGERRQHPAASMPCLPRLPCTVTRTNLPDDAECTQASFPATPNPVSSKCATSAATSALTMAPIADAMIPATFAVIAAIAPGDGRRRNAEISSLSFGDCGDDQ